MSLCVSSGSGGRAGCPLLIRGTVQCPAPLGHIRVPMRPGTSGKLLISAVCSSVWTKTQSFFSVFQFNYKLFCAVWLIEEINHDLKVLVCSACGIFFLELFQNI